ncbi:EamA family transporter [Pseudomonas fluorescens]|uniref:EamA domain-containing protein n=1 Tax=Pseudomonas fluorescens TaxID=294 RepID=A0A423M6R1_PSEFL|nr:EamA family transporter [Pseudomonas fluorescens]RON77843.1 hypothetical protein BK670_21580 [Pseudomonas fluorescens]
MKDIVFLLVYVFGMVFGQVLFKRVAISISTHGSIYAIAGALLTSFEFFMAIGIYGLLTIYWIWLLRSISISYAYPFVSLSIAIMVFLGWWLWGEKINWFHISGVFFILVGVVLVGVSGD